MKPAKCIHVCPTCPWLKANHGAPNPPGFAAAKAKDAGLINWYSTANLKRVWQQIRRGDLMSCHNTEPDAHEWGGKQRPGAQPNHCAGALVAVIRHTDALNAAASLKDYKAKAGKLAMTRQGFIRWVERATFGGGLPSVQTPAEIAVPWDDPVINRADENNPR